MLNGYGSRRLWYERQKDDELATLSRKIASAKGMLAKRNPDISEYAESYEYLYGSRRLWYERQKDDELATLSRKIASAKGMLAKRNPDISEYAESYEYFKKQRLLWMKEVKAGHKTREEYREWLLYMQSQKRIKEASNGNDREASR